VLPKLRGRYQTQIEQHLKEAREQARRARDEARKAADQLRKRMRYRIEVEEGDEDEAHVSTKTRVVTIDDYGRITVIIGKDGRQKTLEFDSWEELEDQDPDLYDELRSLIDDADEESHAPISEQAHPA
jgi:hypothetical protein